MTPPEPFTWQQRDAGLLRCERCGTTVDDVALDLHLMTCPGSTAD